VTGFNIIHQHSIPGRGRDFGFPDTVNLVLRINQVIQITLKKKKSIAVLAQCFTSHGLSRLLIRFIKCFGILYYSCNSNRKQTGRRQKL